MMSAKKGYIFGILIGLSALVIVLIVWTILARTTQVRLSYTIMGAFLLSSGLIVGLFGLYLPKADIRSRAFLICAISGALAGIGCLFIGVGPAEFQQTKDWIPLLLGLGSFAGFQILLVYLVVKVRRKQS